FTLHTLTHTSHSFPTRRSSDLGIPVLDGIITTIMATIQRINIIGSREGSRNRRRLKANQTGKKFRVGIKSNISTNRNNLISGVKIGRAVQQECRDRTRMPSSA